MLTPRARSVAIRTMAIACVSLGACGDGDDHTTGSGDGDDADAADGRDGQADGTGDAVDAPDNRAPTVAILEPGPGELFAVGATVTVRAEVSDDLSARERLAWALRSTLAGALAAGTGVGDTLEVAVVLRAAGRDTLTLEVTDEAGLIGGATVVIEVVVRPEVGDVRIEPAAPDTDDLLTAFVANPDASLTYSYSWTADGVAAATGPVVAAAATERGQRWVVTVIATTRGELASPPATAEVLIGNAAPRCDEAVLLPVAGDADTNFHCDCLERGDADDGDPAVDRCRFYDGERLLAEVDATDGRCDLDASLTERGQDLGCAYLPGDGEDVGPAVTSGRVPLDNARPPRPSAVLEPADPGIDTLMRCVVTPGGPDPDGDEVTFVYAWVVGGVQGNASTSAEVTPRQLGAARGDAIACRVQADDRLDRSAAGESNAVIVGDAAPTGGTVQVGPSGPGSPVEGDVLTCSADGAVDPDGDEVGWTYRWVVDGVEVVGQTVWPTTPRTTRPMCPTKRSSASRAPRQAPGDIARSIARQAPSRWRSVSAPGAIARATR